MVPWGLVHHFRVVGHARLIQSKRTNGVESPSPRGLPSTRRKLEVRRTTSGHGDLKIDDLLSEVVTLSFWTESPSLDGQDRGLRDLFSLTRIDRRPSAVEKTYFYCHKDPKVSVSSSSISWKSTRRWNRGFITRY